ncbi:MAG TPA: SIMPL domain-containing protein [Streptosporangiaceae bacterium]
MAGLIEYTGQSKQEAMRSVAANLDRLTGDLAARGGVPFDQGTERRPLTWAAHSWTTREEHYRDKDTGRLESTGQVTATTALQVTVRALDTLEALSAVLADHGSLNVHAVTWHVDWDNPAWPQVRAAAILAAVRKGHDYAAALGGTLHRVEHIADVGLLTTGNTVEYTAGRVPARALSPLVDQSGTPSLTPVPQELIATIEARFRTTGISLPDT